jgi:hypothetical protein
MKQCVEVESFVMKRETNGVFILTPDERAKGFMLGEALQCVNETFYPPIEKLPGLVRPNLHAE